MTDHKTLYAARTLTEFDGP